MGNKQMTIHSFFSGDLPYDWAVESVTFEYIDDYFEWNLFTYGIEIF